MISIFGVNMRRLRQVLNEESEIETKQTTYEEHTVHGFKCRNLAKSHDDRKRELLRRVCEPNLPPKRIMHANYSRSKLPALIEKIYEQTNSEESIPSPDAETPGPAHYNLPQHILKSTDSLMSQQTHCSSVTSSPSPKQLVPKNTRGRRSTILNRPDLIELKPSTEKTCTAASNHPKLQTQLIECDAIVDRFKSKGLEINEGILKRALVRPEEIAHAVTPTPQKPKKVWPIYPYFRIETRSLGLDVYVWTISPRL